MNYEKKYKEALKRAKYYKEGITDRKLYKGENIMDYIFPELKENKGEKIRKEIVDYLRQFIPHIDHDLVVRSKVWIAWLEKQGEQPY